MKKARFLLWTSLLLVAVCGGLAALHAEEPGGRVVVSAGAAGLEWQPAAGHAGYTLTVSGPGGLLLRRDFDSGSRLLFEPFTERGGPLPDGSYDWELRAVPAVDRDTRKALAEARRKGDDSIVERLRAAGKLPAGPLVESGTFAVRDGAIVPPDLREREEGAPRSIQASSGIRSISEETIIPDDLYVQGRACVGSPDCNPAAEALTTDTLKLKSNNTRLIFDDTSASGFPANDWRLTANDSASGGSSHFSLEDATAGTVPVSVRAGAPSNSLIVSGSGRVGLRTSTPVLDVHLNTGNTPALRLEQNSSGGFTVQTWDIAGNEANFFVRDVTGGSKLPFRIRPGAPTSSIDVAASGNVGIGTATPDARLDVEASGSVEVRLTAAGASTWRLLNDATGFGIELAGAGFRAVNVDSAGNMVIQGTLTQGSSRDLKTGFAALDPREALARVTALPVALWSYKADGPAVRHLGPTAEDFHQAFGLGADDKHIAPGDQAGVALLALQGLTQVVEEKDREIADLRSRLEALERKLAELAEGRTAATER